MNTERIPDWAIAEIVRGLYEANSPGTRAITQIIMESAAKRAQAVRS